MFKNYFNIALRTLLKNRFTTFVNIFGLGLSMSVGLMILIRTQDALSIDQFHYNAQNTYRITSEYHPKGGDHWKMASTPLPLANTLLNENSFIKAAVNVYPALNGMAIANNKELQLNAAFTQPAFFLIFGFSMMEGNPSTALKDPNSIVITRALAENFFGQTNVIGQTIRFNNTSNFIITGVLNTAPGQSHLHYDAYASASSISLMEQQQQLTEKSADWFAFNAAYTYVLLENGTQESTLQAALKTISRTLNNTNKEGTAAFEAQPLSQISPGNEFLANDNAIGSSWTKIYVEVGFSLLILLAACFNYTNLTIAKALTRAKEVGIRKIAGAKRTQLFAQYIFESTILSMFALAFAWVLLSFIVQYAPFNDGYEFIPSSFHYNNSFIIGSVIYALFTGLIAGCAPAWVLSSFKPLRVLKNLSTAKIMGRVSLQKTLIVFQYSLSLVVIVFLVVFYKQFSYMSKTDPGFKRDNVLVIPLNGLNTDIVASTVRAINGVQSVAAASSGFTPRFSGMHTTAWLSNKKESFNLNYYYVNPDFVSNMRFRFSSGHNFSQGNNNYILLNEKATQALGFTNVMKAVGEKIWIDDTTQLQIAGVLQDFSYERAGRPIYPLAFRIKNDAYNYLFVESNDKNSSAFQQRIKTALNASYPSIKADFFWLSDDIDKSNSQAATISLLGYLGFIALAIATLGLLGLVTYTVEAKNKEIGIRKVVGASNLQLVNILSKGYIKLLFIAGFIALPIGWVLSVLFLQNFNNRIHFGFINLMICFLFLLSVGLITIISQTYKAATVNPAKSLRTE